MIGGTPPPRADRLPPLPAVLRRDALAPRYLEAVGTSDHRKAAATATGAAEAAVQARSWWVADAWAHRALWHFERAEMGLAATRAARRIGDIRVAGGDPVSARRYYAEAISEARDIGAEREEGLAALGLGRAELDRGDVTTARRLAGIAETLLASASAPAAELEAARALRGVEKSVGQGAAGDAATQERTGDERVVSGETNG